MSSIDFIVIGYTLVITLTVNYLLGVLRRYGLPRAVYPVFGVLIGLLGFMSTVFFLLLTDPSPVSTQILVSVMFFWVSGFLTARAATSARK